MKFALPSVMALGVLVFGAAASQAYGPSPGSWAGKAAEAAITKVQHLHADDPMDYRLRVERSKRLKKGDTSVVAGPSRCAPQPNTRCKGRGWVCLRRDEFQKCCARWTCAADIKNPQTKQPFDIRPKPLPRSRRLPPNPIMR